MTINAKLYNIIGYIACIILSVGLGWVSTTAGSDLDYVQELSNTTIPILLTLLVLYSTLTINLINELKKFDASSDLKPVVNSLRNNIIHEIIILLLLIILLVFRSPLCKWFPDAGSFIQIICNSFVVFSLLFFIWVIFDVAMGLYDLVIKNTNDGK